MSREQPYIHKIFILVVLGFSLMLTSCISSDNAEAGKIEMLRVGILPDQSEKILRKKYIPLLDYISQEMNVAYELFIPASYDELLEKFHNGEINIALFGGYTFIKAWQQDDAVPLLMRDIDEKFHSDVLVQTNHPAKTLGDLKGVTFSFGSQLSTSGHLMPRYFFKEENINPDTFFGEIKYSNAHDITAEWVRDGVVEAGVVNSKVVNKMFLSGRLNDKDIRILWTSPPYPNYVWAVQTNINDHDRNEIIKAFLSLTSENKSHIKILQGLQAGYFLPVSIDKFSSLKQIVKHLEEECSL